MNREELEKFLKEQLANWPLAEKNFKALESVRRKPFKIGDFEGWVQFNPARAVSTLAKVDAESVKSRPCFLCKENRPQQQSAIEILPGFQLLVNPFPILPMHFTIASTKHIPQELFPEYGEALARELPGMMVFFNGIGAGASAPDHLHFQAVPIEQLPLFSNIKIGNTVSLEFTSQTDSLNAYFWTDAPGNDVNSFVIPRIKHRPESFFLLPPMRRAVSPGAIDMAGIIVVPYLEDFEAITSSDIEKIYKEVAPEFLSQNL